MTISCIYTEQPLFPPTDQAPGALRVQIGALWVDYTGAVPTQADVDAILNPDSTTTDSATIDAQLASLGSFDRALFILVLNQLNVLRAAVTTLNTKTATTGNNVPQIPLATAKAALQTAMRGNLPN